MKLVGTLILFGTLLSTAVSAQPYEFDQSGPASIEIVLFDDPHNEGVKLGSVVGTLQNQAERLYINGLIEYQPVDLFVAPADPGEEVTVNLVKATWEDVLDTCTSNGDTACQFKVRTLGDVGISISGDTGTEYVLLAVVGAEIRPHLETPFYEINEADLGALESAKTTEPAAAAPDSGSETSMYLLVGLIILLLAVIAFLLGKKTRHGSAMALALTVALLFGNASMAQDEVSDEMRELIQQEIEKGVRAEMTRFRNALDRIEGVTDIAEKVNEARKLEADFDKFRSSYKELGDCINAGPGYSARERIPSFCEDQEGCDKCFLAAREQFNLSRYYLTRLATIHSCTIQMTDSAKAFGDSFSSATKSGLGWYDARLKIEESVKSLNKAYDAKYAELMGDLGNSMADMAVCEAQYGLEDWYDRFGFMYFEFVKDKYKRE